DAYLRALATLPKLTVVEGRYKDKHRLCDVLPCVYAGDRTITIPEEKRTDVNIAVQMMDDAYQNTCDTFVVVSGDSDLVPALYRVKQRFPMKKLVVYVPARNKTRGAAVEMRAAADKNATLPLNLLQHAQLPANVPDGSGGFITKPASW